MINEFVLFEIIIKKYPKELTRYIGYKSNRAVLCFINHVTTDGNQ